MTESTQNLHPSLIVLTGRPGSGKSTLAHSLGRAVRCPVVCRDEIKEGWVNTAGPAAPADADEVGRHVYQTFFDTVNLLLTRRITLIAEAAFQHKVWAPKLEPLCAIARVRIILCTVDPALARSRQLQRGSLDPGRERFHPDPAVQAARDGMDLPIGDYHPPHLEVPMLVVDTSDGYRPSFESIVAFASA